MWNNNFVLNREEEKLTGIQYSWYNFELTIYPPNNIKAEDSMTLDLTETNKAGELAMQLLNGKFIDHNSGSHVLIAWGDSEICRRAVTSLHHSINNPYSCSLVNMTRIHGLQKL